MAFLERVAALPKLGIGVSTEYGANRAGGLLPLELAAREPRYAQFLELGIEVEKGLDADALAWLEQGRRTTYHFLDINLDEEEDFDRDWLQAAKSLVAKTNPAWVCGDAGLWHFGPRERGHMLLLPPILIREQAESLGRGIARLRHELDREVLPENPPGTAFVGDLHMLPFFAQLCEEGDTGMLLDVAHLALYQHVTGHQPLDGFADFPYERVIELHVAGGVPRETQGFSWIEDTHDTAVLPATWEILEHVVQRATNLKAIIYECERNRIDEVLPGFARIDATWQNAEQREAR
jgi:uncharacterized protein (UPF0276 family)